MKFSSFNRSVSSNVVTLRNPEGIRSVASINYYADDATGTITKKELRWSFDREYWSSWEPLTQPNVSSIDPKSSLYLFMEVRYTFGGSVGGSNDVNSFTLDYNQADSTSVPTTPETESSTGTTHIHIYESSYSQIKPVTVYDSSLLNSMTGAYYLNRANHTGTQEISTVTGLSDTLSSLLSNVGQFSNIGNGDASLYYGKISNVHTFREIGTNSPDVLVYTQGDTVMIDVSGLANLSYVNGVFNDLRTMDSSIGLELVRLDSSLSTLTRRVEFDEAGFISELSQMEQRITATEASMSYVVSALNLMEASVSYSTSRVVVLDASLYALTNRHNVTESSVNTLTLYAQGLGSDLNLTKNRLTVTESSLYSLTIKTDSSILYLLGRLNVTDASLLTLGTQFLSYESSTSNAIAVLDSSIVSVKTSLSKTDASLSSLTSRVITLESSVNSLALRDGVNEASIGYLANRISVIDSSVQYLMGADQLLSNRVQLLEASVNYMDASISFVTLKSYANEASISRIDSSVLGLIGRVNVIDSSLISLSVRISVTDTSLLGVATSLGKTDSSLFLIGGRLAATESSLGILTLRHNVTEASLASLTAYSQGLGSDLTTLTLRHNKTEASLYALTIRYDSSVTDVYYRLGTIDASVQTLTGRVNVIDASIAVLMQGGGTTALRAYVDGSLYLRDVSMDWLNSNKVNRFGDVMTGGLVISSGGLVVNNDVSVNGFLRVVTGMNVAGLIYDPSQGLIVTKLDSSLDEYILTTSASGVVTKRLAGGSAWIDASSLTVNAPIRVQGDASVSLLSSLTISMDKADSSTSGYIDSIDFYDFSTRLRGVANVDVCTGNLSSASVYSYDSSGYSYLKRIVVDEGITITEDGSTIRFTVNATSYRTSFVADGSSTIEIPYTTHGLGSGPFSISLYELNSQVYVDNQVDSSGNVTINWIQGNLTGNCRLIISS